MSMNKQTKVIDLVSTTPANSLHLSTPDAKYFNLLPPLPLYNPKPHTPALFYLNEELMRCDREKSTDLEYFQVETRNLVRSETVLRAHQAWLSLGKWRFLPWHVFRLLVALL